MMGAGNALAHRTVSRGRPLLMLVLVLGSWATIRAATWDASLPQIFEKISAPIVASGDPVTAPEKSVDAARPAPVPVPVREAEAVAEAYPAPDTNGLHYPAYLVQPLPAPHHNQIIAPPQSNEVGLETAAAHQLLWMAAMAYMPIPASLRKALDKPATAVATPLPGTQQLPAPRQVFDEKGADRWSLDAWAFWRQGSGSSLVALGRAQSYGASQAGAVLRYALAPDSARKPNFYARAYSTLEGRSEQEFSVGVSARPLAQIPLRAHVEARALRSGGTIKTRAAGFVTTEIPPVKLPAGFSGEVYAQAGYVTGANRTGFADGQAHVTREVAQFDLAKVNLGAAAFAGVQKGAQRADIGPSMRVTVKLGDQPAQLSVDWRERVAGDAEPDSGLAVTLSTRF